MPELSINSSGIVVSLRCDSVSERVRGSILPLAGSYATVGHGVGRTSMITSEACGTIPAPMREALIAHSDITKRAYTCTRSASFTIALNDMEGLGRHKMAQEKPTNQTAF